MKKIALAMFTLLSFTLVGCGGSSSDEVEAADISAPLITLVGGATVSLVVGDVYTEEGATVTDNVDTNLTIAISGAVDTSTAGTYNLTYTASDLAGNQSTVTRDIIVELPVIADTQAPMISLVGDANVNLTVGDTYTEAGATVTDNVDTNLTAGIEGTVDTSIADTYNVTYSVSDAAGNAATAIRTVVVSDAVVITGDAYIFDSSNLDTFGFDYWGDDWDSGTQYTDNPAEFTIQPADTTYARSFEFTKSSGWGTVIAWGNEPQNTVDVSAYTHARFKVKSDTFTGVSVFVQSATLPESQIAYNFLSGTPLDNGWIEMEVTLPGFSDMTWFALNFIGETGTTVLLADVYFTTLDLEPITGPAAGAPNPPPSLSNDEAVVLYSESLDNDGFFIGLWNANYFEAPIYSTGNYATGNVNNDSFAKYTITAGGTNGGVTGLEFGFENGALDASQHTIWNMDLFVEPSINKVILTLVSEDGEVTHTITDPTTNAWLPLALQFNDPDDLTVTKGGPQDTFDVLNSSTLQLIAIQLYGEEGASVYVDNIYFSGEASFYDLSVTVSEGPIRLASAKVSVGDVSAMTDAQGVATLTLPEGEHKVYVDRAEYGVLVDNQSISGGDASLSMNLVPLNTGPSVAAEIPTATNEEAFVLYSDTLNVDKPISFWNDNFFKAPTFTEISIGEDKIARFQIIPDGEDGGITGVQYGIQNGSIDVSSYTGLRFDLYVTSGITQAEFQLIQSFGGGVGFSGVQSWPTEQWISVELPFSEFAGSFDPAILAQLGVKLWGSTSDSVYMDNIYFY
jgi:hypothetical protein